MVAFCINILLLVVYRRCFFDDGAAKANGAVIKDDRLAWSDGTHGLGEAHVHPALLDRLDDAGLL